MGIGRRVRLGVANIKLECKITTSVISKAKNFVKKNQKIKEIKISKKPDRKKLLEQYENNIKELSDYATDPDNGKYEGLYMDYRAVVALLSPLKSFRNIPKYCSLSLLEEILKLENDGNSGGGVLYRGTTN